MYSIFIYAAYPVRDCEDAGANPGCTGDLNRSPGYYILRQATIHTYRQLKTHQFTQMHVFGLWEETHTRTGRTCKLSTNTENPFALW